MHQEQHKEFDYDFDSVLKRILIGWIYIYIQSEVSYFLKSANESFPLKPCLRSRFLRFFNNRKTRFSRLLNLLRFSWSVVNCWHDENDLFWILNHISETRILQKPITRKVWFPEKIDYSKKWFLEIIFSLKTFSSGLKNISKKTSKSMPIFDKINNIFVEKNFN